MHTYISLCVCVCKYIVCSLFSICNKNLLSIFFSVVVRRSFKLGLKDEEKKQQRQQQSQQQTRTQMNTECKKGNTIQTSWLFINDSCYMLLWYIGAVVCYTHLQIHIANKRENSSSNATVSFFIFIFLVRVVFFLSFFLRSATQFTHSRLHVL